MGENFLETHAQSFVHLHLHTQYSLLDGAIRIKDLVRKAKEFGMPAVAQTDHGNMFGAIDFYQSMKKEGIRPILGSEIYFTPGSRFDRRPPKKTQVLASQDETEGKHRIHHLVLLVKNLTGYHNLCKLLSKAYLEGFYYKPRADIELLKEFGEGLVATTACLKGEVGYNFFTGQDERSHSAIYRLREIFKDDFYLELQENGIPEQDIVNKKVISFAKEQGIPLVATNDSHYLEKDDSSAQEVLLCVQTGKTFNDEKRMKLSTQEFYFKSPQEMRKAFARIPDACDNTLRIANKCNLELPWLGDNKVYHLPGFEIETKESETEYFRRLSYEGLEQRFQGPSFKKIVESEDWPTQKEKYLARLESEVSMISKMGFQGYFLIVSDFIMWAKEKSIAVGPGRGSGAGSLVAYALQITNINPLPYNLLFERFINPERISMPDFDVDFCQERREEVIQYVNRKYGQERVGQIITFGKLQAKGVIRDVGRVFALPYSETDALAKLIPDELGITLERAIELEPKLKELEDSDPKIHQILKISRRLEGLLRHASIHAAGVIITNEPLVNYCPLFRGKMGEQVVQFDKDYSEEIGLVKFDFLGLKTLTVIDNAVRLIRETQDIQLDIDGINIEDKKVFDVISTGETTGIFQLESSGMKDLCKRLRPDTLEDITAINALYRPGPLGSGMVDDFVEIKHGRKKISYPFPPLEPILKDTYGIIVYQEQVMNIARIVAGYSLGQADILRKAMGKKKISVMEEHRKIFSKGALENGFDQKKALELFDLMAKFAEYGFNKSHAVAYAMIAYQTAYLKVHYPQAFYAALLSTELNNTDKITNYIQDAASNNIKTFPPSINESHWAFYVVGDNIRFGLGAIKNVGEGAVNEIVLVREKEGPFKGLIDFCERINFKNINKRVIESMIKVGVFDECEEMNRRTQLENLEIIMQYAQKTQIDRLRGQTSLFDQTEETKIDPMTLLNITENEEFQEREKLSYEKELMGIYVSGHPLKGLEDVIPHLTTSSIGQVHEEEGTSKKDVTLAGIIVTKKNLLTKKGDRMAFATLEDFTGKIECVIFPKTFQMYQEFLGDDRPLIMEGSVNYQEDPRKFFPNKITPLDQELPQKIRQIKLRIPLENGDSLRKLEELREIVPNFRGHLPLTLIFEGREGKVRINTSDDYHVSARPKFLSELKTLFGNKNVCLVQDAK